MSKNERIEYNRIVLENFAKHYAESDAELERVQYAIEDFIEHDIRDGYASVNNHGSEVHSFFDDDGGYDEGDMMKFYDDAVEDVGWAVVYVETAEDQAFCYSVGLSLSPGYPELIVFGLEQETSQDLIGAIATHWKDNGQVTLGTISGVLKNGMSLKLRPVKESRLYPMSFASDYRAHRDEDPFAMPIVQIIYPDANGRFEESDHQPWLQPKPFLVQGDAGDEQ